MGFPARPSRRAGFPPQPALPRTSGPEQRISMRCNPASSTPCQGLRVSNTGDVGLASATDELAPRERMGVRRLAAVVILPPDW
ncbi:hypothetical protein Phou_053770 [Phytohabitans houttuyneae]|uniref:Uncharacterized protein n=1 Tax=Phytohabitans houttuyneae TaxID=1076126 RepID=A0A6V8KHL9_9ACTN|nr:hypothetical protein Phou_053770 [Phytohabitans houttuyneae]